MAKRVYLCDGHGNNTSGKRTPTYSNGTYIRENTFNKAVVKLLVNTLKYQGISPLEVAPEDTDTALATRTNRANADYKKKAFSDYIYCSIHYNAMSSTWNENVGGLETYYYPGSTKGKKLATAVQKYLLKGVSMKNRGVKSANFHVLRETNMVACLAECGFMDNPDEAKLMTSVDYQTECANEITQGICEYFGLTYKTPVKEEDEEARLTAYLKIISPTYWKVWLAHFKANPKLNWQGFVESALKNDLPK